MFDSGIPELIRFHLKAGGPFLSGRLESQIRQNAAALLIMPVRRRIHIQRAVVNGIFLDPLLHGSGDKTALFLFISFSLI